MEISIVRQALALLEEGGQALLAVVVKREGSAPRGPGAVLLLTSAGPVAGTVGGGGLEAQAIQEGQALLAQGEARLCRYNLGPEAAAYCGGQVELLYYPLQQEDRQVLQELLDRLQRPAAPCALLWPLAGGRLRLEEAAAPSCQEREGRAYYAQVLNGEGYLYLFGSGHVAQALVPVLARAGFRCLVCDDRPAFLTPAFFPEAEELRLIDYQDLSAFKALGPRDYAVVMTRGHRYDSLVEAALLQSQAGYIGVMGSRGKAQLVRRDLAALGFSPEQLGRVYTPIGLEIGSETPGEIAISIAAQLVAVRHGL